MSSIPEGLQALAFRINTGSDNPDISRALIVFNHTNKPLSGVAVFHAAISWPQTDALPPILVSEITGNVVPAAVWSLAVAPDVEGRPDRHQISFDLGFAVSETPANGWRTYIASYAGEASPPLAEQRETPGLTVVETTRHGGDLPPVGAF